MERFFKSLKFLSRHSLFTACLGYLLIVLVVFYPVLLPPKGMLLFGDDVHRSYHFFRIYLVDSIRQGLFPWWNPYLFSGMPFIANPSVSVWYPFNWLFLLLPYNRVYSLLVPMHIVLAMSAMFWFAKKWLPLRSAWLAGLAFGFSGYFMGRIVEGHIDIITSVPYMPIVFGLFWEAFEKKTPRSITLAGIFLAIQMYAGYQTIALFTLEAIGIAALLYCFFVRSLRPLMVLGIATGIGLGLAAFQIIPGQEFLSRSIRTFPLPYSWVTFGSFSWNSFVQFIFPFAYGGPDRASYVGPRPNYGEMAAYFGIIPLGLAVLGGIAHALSNRSNKSDKTNKQKIPLVLITVALFSLWVSLGPNAPVDLQYVLWRIFPFYHYLRIPARHLVLFVFAASFLAGFGLTKIKNHAVGALLIFITIVDLVVFARHFVGFKPDPSTRHNAGLIQYLQSNAYLFRWLPNFNVGIGTRDALDFDAALAYRLQSATGYDPSILRNYYEFIAAANGVEHPDVAQNDVQVPPLDVHSQYTDFLNIKYVFVPNWLDSVGGDSHFTQVLEDKKIDYWKLYKNNTVWPRFFFVSNALEFPDRQSVAREIRNRQINLRQTVLLTTSKYGPGCPDIQSAGTVKIISYAVHRIELETNTSCGGYLTGSEVYYPGWNATIDGKETELLEGNLAFRTIFLPAGNHRVIFIYKPMIFVWGGIVSLVTLALSLLWIKLSTKK